MALGVTVDWKSAFSKERVHVCPKFQVQSFFLTQIWNERPFLWCKNFGRSFCRFVIIHAFKLTCSFTRRVLVSGEAENIHRNTWTRIRHRTVTWSRKCGTVRKATSTRQFTHILKTHLSLHLGNRITTTPALLARYLPMNYMAVCYIAWRLTDWLIDWLINWLIDWLIDWLRRETSSVLRVYSLYLTQICRNFSTRFSSLNFCGLIGLCFTMSCRTLHGIILRMLFRVAQVTMKVANSLILMFIRVKPLSQLSMCCMEEHARLYSSMA